ncbi:MAG: hypothetical protein ACYC09_05145 [Bacteroidota bacterium]
MIPIRSTLLPILICMTLAGCEDTLPEYILPEDFFIVDVLYYDTTQFTFYSTNISDTLTVYRYFGQPIDYVFWAKNPSNPMIFSGTPFKIHFQMYIENIYEETMQSPADVQATLEIWSKDHPRIRSVETFDNSIFFGSPLYSLSNSSFTIDPGERLYFTVGWDFKLDNGRYIHEYGRAPKGGGTKGSIEEIIFSDLPLMVRFSIRLTERSKVYVVEREIPLKLRCLYYWFG